MNAALCFVDKSISTCQNPLFRSRKEKYFGEAAPSESNTSSSCGKGNDIGMVDLLGFRYSPVGFLTRRTGECHSEFEGSMMSFCKSSCTCRSISVRFWHGINSMFVAVCSAKVTEGSCERVFVFMQEVQKH